MKFVHYIMMTIFIADDLEAQTSQKDIIAGNRSYREGKYLQAAESYKRALTTSPANTIASFNLANAYMKSENPGDAEKMYDVAISNGRTDEERSAVWYNKGVSLSRQGKIGESIDAYKQALRMNPLDTLARENLVRAIREQKKKQQQEENERQKKEDKKKDQPPPPMNEQQIQQLLQALREQEKKLRQKVQKARAPAPGQPEKDW
jgi:tetratricopeptide (TPR) repeat protein